MGIAHAKYWPHIDGLRGVAVLLVFLFHLAPDIFPGGYLGVDVFFVISGFVITASLYKSYLKTGRVQLKQFYIRRVLRLYPALITMVTVTTITFFLFGFLWDTNLFVKIGISSILGISNLFYIYNSGDYFQDDFLNPLLHTWSLGLEEQFYVLYPLLLMGLLYVSRNICSATLIIGLMLLLVSVALYASFVINESNLWGNYYWPVARFWELLAGCALFFFAQNFSITRFWRHLSWIGAGLIIGIGSLQHLVQDVYSETLLVVLGTVLVIFAGLQEKSVVTKVFESRPLVWIGLISYSLYLWHLPVIYFFNLYTSEGTYVVGSIVTSFILALVSYKYVECRYRHATYLVSHVPKLIGVGAGVMVLLVLCVFAYGISQSKVHLYASINAVADGIQSINYLESKASLSTRVEQAYLIPGISEGAACGRSDGNLDHEGEHINQACLQDNDQSTIVYLTGDSHALHLLPMLDASPIASDIYYFPLRVMDMLVDDFTDQSSTASLQEQQLQELSNEYKQVYVIQSFFLSHFSESEAQQKTKLSQRIEQLAPYAKIVLVAPTPVFSTGPVSCVAVGVHCSLDTEVDRLRRQSALRMLQEFAAGNEKVYLYDPYEALCSEEKCFIYDEATDKLLYRDDDHISVETSISLAPHFSDWFRRTFSH